MARARVLGLAACAVGLLLAGSALAAVAVESVVPLNGTALGEVPAGGRASAVGVLVATGTTKGSLLVKAAKGSTLAPRVSLAWPDGTTRDEDALAALGAVVKITPKSVSIKNLPEFAASGLYKVLVTGAPGTDGRATAGGYSVKIAGKATKGFAAPPATIATVAEKDDYPFDLPENTLLAVTLKPSKATPFGVSLKILTATGDEIPAGAYTKVGKDDSISIKNMPVPVFGRCTFRVGSTAATGEYTLSVKVKVSKKPAAAAGAPVADAGGPYFVEPSGKGTLDGSGTTGASSYLWVPVSGPALSISNKVVNPTLNMPAGRATYAWQLVATNPSGTSLPSLAIVEVDRAPIADAGPGAAVTGGPVELDASSSADLDAGETLHYAWQQEAGPAVALDDPFAQKPSFTPSAAGTYVFSLVVHDGVLASERSLAVVSMGAGGAAADAGRIVLVRPQDSVFLSGLRSRKGDGTAPAQWAWTAHPSNGAAVVLAGANGPVASFTAPKQPAFLRFRLAVEGDASNADEVGVLVTNGIPVNGTPVANAGGLLSPALSAGFTLNGSGSTDDGSVQAHEWMQADGPDADLQQASSASASGTAPASAAVLRFLLMVHDGRKYSAPDTAMVAAGAPASPVASAGPDRSGVSGGPNLVLTSAASTPAPGDAILSRQWTQLSGKDWYDVDAKDPGFDPTAASPVIKVPTDTSSLSPSRTLHFGLAVTDGTGTSREDVVAVNFLNLPKNAPPSVSASTPAAVVRPATTVSLSASASDPDGDPLSYSWTQVSGPAAVVNGATLANASVTAPIASATLTYRVTVSDNTGEGNGTVTADVSFSVNRPPVLLLSTTPASGPATTLVTLNGSGTTDPENETLSYLWEEVPPYPNGTQAQLTSTTTATTQFVQPAYSGTPTARRRTFRLTATDSLGPVSQTTVFNPNRGPGTPVIAASGDRKVFYTDSADTSVPSNKSETLSVTPLTDLDGDALTFTWTVESGPITSTATLLSSTTGSTITFKSAPKPSQSQNNTGGVYNVGVVASDGVEQSVMSTVDMLVYPAFAADVYSIVQGSCNSGACHGSAASSGNGFLDLRSPASTARTNLLNGRVTAGNYANSSFFTKLNDGSMPQGAQKLPQQLINIVRDWIEPEWNVTSSPGLSGGAENN